MSTGAGACFVLLALIIATTHSNATKHPVSSGMRLKSSYYEAAVASPAICCMGSHSCLSLDLWHASHQSISDDVLLWLQILCTAHGTFHNADSSTSWWHTTMRNWRASPATLTP